MMKSIASRLFWTQLTASLVLAVIVGLVLYLRVKSSFVAEFDRALAGKASSLAAIMRIGPKGFDADFDKAALPELDRKQSPVYLQVTDLAFKTFYRSPSLGDRSLNLGESNQRTEFNDLPLPDGALGREVIYRFVPTYDDDTFPPGGIPTTAPPAMYLVLAETRHGLDERLHSFLLAMLVAAGTMTVGIVVVTVVTMKTGLWHLRRFAYEVEQFDINQLHVRIHEESVPTEIQPIAARLNQLLSRLEAAFTRERRFTADAAHELRTPIAELRTLSEVALRNTSTPPDVRQFFGDALDISKQMEALVSTLLALARGQTVSEKGRIESLDFSELFSATWRYFEPEAEKKKLACAGLNPPGVRVQGDRVILISILRNLLSNAVDHSPVGGRLEWDLRVNNGSTYLSLRNSNHDLTKADLPHLTEPFWQKNTSRNGQRHSGLGLALVKAWSENLHARMDFNVVDGGNMFEARLELKSSQES